MIANLFHSRVQITGFTKFDEVQYKKQSNMIKFLEEYIKIQMHRFYTHLLSRLTQSKAVQYHNMDISE